MAITSENKRTVRVQFRSVQFRYAVVYVVVTFIALLFLNIYCSKISQQLFYSSKKASMIEICHLTASQLSGLEVMNETTISSTVADLAAQPGTRIIVVDHDSRSLYDSARDLSTVDHFVLYPEIITAIEGNDVFFWRYHAGAMQSFAATPIVSHSRLIGCVYITEYDDKEGALIASIQSNILTSTIFLEIVVIIFSFASSNTYSRRLRKIMNSIRSVRDGDYSHKLEIGGRDELNMLGNEFNDLIHRLRVSENKRSQFVSDASHELKTPLASIKLLSDSILQNNMDGETIREFVGDIGNEAERLNKMSQKLLTLSKIEGQVEDTHEIVVICPTIHRVVRMLSVNAQKNGITVEMDLDESCSILILEDDLYQIIFNLVENGIKYNVPGGTLTIGLKREDDYAIISIKDTGVGIPPESLDHVFERFYRVDKARSRSTGGSGLGLSIVRNIVRRNQGEITVSSEIGIGTTFELRFPIFEIPEVTS